MPTTTGHTTAIRASKVIGTDVKNATGDKIGKIEDVVLDKTGNNIMFAVVGFGGFLGVGEKYHPLPWAMLDYVPGEDGYVVSATKEQLESAPSDSMEALTKDDGNTLRERVYAHYNTPRTWQ